MRTHIYLAAILSTMIFGAVNCAMAEDVIEKLSARQLEKILEDLVDAEILEDVEERDAADTYVFKSNNMTVLLINNHDDLQLHCVFSSDKVISLSKINDWNRHNIYSRAYLDEDRDPVLEADLLLTGGVSEKRIGLWIGFFCISMNEYIKTLEED